MRPTFFGFEIGKKAMNAGQLGLDVTGQNISNVNTEGYARRKVLQSTDSTSTGVYMFSDPIKAKVGAGVNVDGVIQSRNKFLDLRYYKQNAEQHNFETAVTGLRDLDDILDEVTSEGLGVRLADFYEKLHNLSMDASGIESSNILRTSAQKLTQVLNQYAEQINGAKSQQLSELNINIDNVNLLLSKINDTNIQIRNEKIQGNIPNELLDLRNAYLDELSASVNISVTENADGSLSVISDGVCLVDSSLNLANNLSVATTGADVSIECSDGSLLTPKDGTIRGHLQLLNGTGSSAGTEIEQFRGIPYYRNRLDSFAQTFSDTFNDLNGGPLFEGDLGVITAENISISQQWLADPQYIKTSLVGTSGKNDNILRMLDAMDSDIAVAPGYNGTFEEFITTLNGEIGVDVDYFTDMNDSNKAILTSIQNQRESVMGVSLDEEATNLLKYQKAYNAAARFMTVLDEALDVIINRMGVVGL